MEFSNSLLHWYLQNKRDLPWRNTTNPYPIWLSEIMLQQTRVAQGMPYFLSFMENFPTVFDLAKADEEQVLKLWQGLGYYSRARNMHKTAQFIALELNGNFPNNYKDLLKLKGIGQYTAAAIASFAFNEVVPVVDGNVFRVLSRYFNVETDIASSTAKKEFTALANELIPKDNPALFNQAIMEFGALQCVPKNPNCSNCIFNSSCAALQLKKVSELPVKLKKTKVTNRYFNYLIFIDVDNHTVINKRVEKGIWQNLYEFPVIETEDKVDFETITDEINEKFSDKKIMEITQYNDNQIIHKLSHQKLHINFYKVEIKNKLEKGIDLETLKTFPFPIVIHNFIEKYSI
ncbi:A/G-specific adenine glycosylase [Flavobacterium sp.]|uniref:A/G-specific adenine glycosylase n=1 Tax=Flavobacterium sp. TaxID=239 RepID=UPI003752BCB6